MYRHLPLLLFIWLGTISTLLGQHYPVRHFGTEVGLPKSMVAGIAQDEDGFLWVGTSGGICRFDGLTFTPHSTEPPMEYFYAKAFLRDSRGDFWLGMSDNGLVRVHAEKAYHFGLQEGLPGNTVWALMEDRSGNLWAGTEKGLAVLRSEALESGDARFQPAFESRLSDLGVHRVVEDEGGRLWINTQAGLFLCVDGQIVRHWSQANRERCLALHSDGFILVAMQGGLYRSQGDSLVAFYLNPRLDGFDLIDLACAGNTVWMASYGQGLLKLEGDHLEVIDERHGLITNYLYSLFVDREGNLWMGSIHGLSQLFEFAFASYTKAEGLMANSVHSLAEDGEGNIYLGGDDGLSVITKDTILTLTHSDENIPLRRIISMASSEEADGVTGLTDDGKRYRLAVRGDRASAVLMSETKSGARGLHLELRDRFGNRWLSTPDSSLYCTTPGGARLHWSTIEGVPVESVFGAGEDTSGAVWFSTIGKGLLRFRDGKFDHFTMADGLPSDHVEDIYVHPLTKELWFTTNKGPLRWRGMDAHPRFETFPEIDKLPSRDFGGLAADREGNMWFTTSGGVIRYDGRRFELFTHEFGLLGGAVIGILVDGEGHVWVGGARGASEIFPERLRSQVEPPRVFLTRMEARGRPLTPSPDIELSHGENDLRFIYQGLSLRYPTGIAYSFRLDGLNPEWSTFSPQNEVRFPSLPAGNYRFSVRAMNVRGVVSDRPAEFAFAILPPLWQRWWFILASSLVTFLTARAIYLWRVRQLLAVERMRTRIAADLHDDIASSLASVALYSEVIQRQLQHTSEDVRNLLGRIRDLSREVMDNIGIIVWTVDPRHDELSEVLSYFQRHASQVCAAAGISFHARFPEKMKPLVLLPEVRRTAYLILKEGLTNILRHAQCTEVEFICELHDRTLDLTLRDNGRGFDIDAVKEGHGLSNMRVRAQAIGAMVEVKPRSGGGTALHLLLKMT